MAPLRLLDVRTYDMIAIEDIPEPLEYAILSHRWLDRKFKETTYDTFSASGLRTKTQSGPSADKIRGACAETAARGILWLWIDSCCINKDSQHEMSKSINSMFSWYKQAKVCLAYLADIDSRTGKKMPPLWRHPSSDIEASSTQPEWFTRGWTLQELLAPADMEFFDVAWSHLGNRRQLAPCIEDLTGIPAAFLDGSVSFACASVAQIMSWQSLRTTKEEEDIAYSLVGILNVTLIPQYGEGKRAFRRLQEEVIRNKKDESIYAWKVPYSNSFETPSYSARVIGGSNTWGLLAPWIDCFRDASSIMIRANDISSRPSPGFQKVAGGIRVPMPAGDLYEDKVGNFSEKMGQIAMGLVGRGLSRLTGIHFSLPSASELYTNVVTLKHGRDYQQQVDFLLTLDCWMRDSAGNSFPVAVVLRRAEEGNDTLWYRHECRRLELRKRSLSELVKWAEQELRAEERRKGLKELGEGGVKTTLTWSLKPLKQGFPAMWTEITILQSDSNE